MKMIDAVFEAPSPRDAGPLPWVVAAREPGSWVSLKADVELDVVGLFVAAMLEDNDIGWGDSAISTLEALSLDSDLIVSGGLRLIGDRVTIVPGCCSGLEDWREWVALLRTDASPWMGHDPAPYARRTEHGVRVWADEPDSASSKTVDLYIDLDDSSLRAELLRVQADMVGFLGRVHDWANAHLLPRPDELTGLIDRTLSISAPLELVQTLRD